MANGLVEQAKKYLKGTIVPLTTPIKEDDSIDFDGLARLTEFYIENGIKTLLAAGTTGYCYTFSEEEHKKVVETVVNVSKGRACIMAGVSHSGTLLANRLADACEEVGADILLMTPPYYHQSSTYEGCFHHYTDVARNRSKGLVVYSIAGGGLDVDFFKRCADIDTIVGVKEATGDYNHARDLLIELGDRLTIVSGGSMRYYLWHWLWGAPGYVASIGNFVPKIERDFYNYLEKGDIQAARKIVTNYEQPFFRVMTAVYSWHECVHAALKIFGLPAHKLRLPLVEPSPEYEEKMRREFNRIGLLNPNV